MCFQGLQCGMARELHLSLPVAQDLAGVGLFPSCSFSEWFSEAQRLVLLSSQDALRWFSTETEDRKHVRSVASQLSQLPQFSCDPCQRQDVQAPVEQLSGWGPGICFLDKGLHLFRCRIKERLSWW